MLSMIFILFLVAVLISLFLGRLAEVLTNRYRHRSKRRKHGVRSIPHPAAATGTEEI